MNSLPIIAQSVSTTIPQQWRAGVKPATAQKADISLRVLVVEDNPVNREVARGFLDRRGHFVVTVDDGAIGVAEWEKGGYDVILMDMQMPVMDGVTATKHIRSAEQTRGGHIPIVALTAHALKEAKQECLAAGMDGYITKPLRRETFLKAVEDFAAAAKTRPMTADPTPAAPLPEIAPLGQPLVRPENMVRFAGPDKDMQRKILSLCAEALAAKMPHLRRALLKNDRTAVEKIAHYLRGAIGMLGLPLLVKMGEDIECRYEVLGAEMWQQRCRQFCEVLCRVEEELRQLHAA